MADVEVHYDFVVKELQGRQKSENLKLFVTYVPTEFGLVNKKKGLGSLK